MKNLLPEKRKENDLNQDWIKAAAKLQSRWQTKTKLNFVNLTQWKETTRSCSRFIALCLQEVNTVTLSD